MAKGARHPALQHSSLHSFPLPSRTCDLSLLGPAEELDGLRAHEATSKLRAVYMNHVRPIALAAFGALFRHVAEWQDIYDVRLWADWVTAVGLAELYWPRAHVDQDAWYTILVALDLGAGMESGGDFSFAKLGRVFQVEHGDVFFFNPWYEHSCTEPAPKPNGSRIFISFYCKQRTLNAGALTAMMHARKGNAPLVMCRVR